VLEPSVGSPCPVCGEVINERGPEKDEGESYTLEKGERTRNEADALGDGAKYDRWGNGSKHELVEAEYNGWDGWGRGVCCHPEASKSSKIKVPNETTASLGEGQGEPKEEPLERHNGSGQKGYEYESESVL
jgi:hypothetical protein